MDTLKSAFERAGRNVHDYLELRSIDPLYRLVFKAKEFYPTSDPVSRMGLSCSNFMLYLGVDKLYDEVPHDSILFAEDYQKTSEKSPIL